jgi:hypothetical protein
MKLPLGFIHIVQIHLGVGYIPMMVYSPQNCGLSQTVLLYYDSSTFIDNGILVNITCSDCPDSLNACNGYLQYNYKAIVILDTLCSDWVFKVNVTRPSNITNINTANNGSIFCTLNNVIRPVDNGQFNIYQQFWQVSANQNLTYTTGVYDPDGDSLFFEKQNPLDSSAFVLPQNSNYNTGYSLINPLGTSSSYSISSNTGTILFNAQQTGLYLHSVKCSEYDVVTKDLLGISIRDYLFYVSPCYTHSVKFDSNSYISDLQGANYSTDLLSDIQIATVNQASFQIKFKTLDLLNFKQIKCNNNIFGSGSTFNYDFVTTADGYKLYTIYFNWTPQIADTGIHNLLFTIRDSMMCNIYAPIEIPINIKVVHFPLSNIEAIITNENIIYPNPAQNILFYKNTNINITKHALEIRNFLNQVVYVNESEKGSGDTQIDVSHFCNGVYFIEDKMNGVFVKFVINK